MAAQYFYSFAAVECAHLTLIAKTHEDRHRLILGGIGAENKTCGCSARRRLVIRNEIGGKTGICESRDGKDDGK